MSFGRDACRSVDFHTKIQDSGHTVYNSICNGDNQFHPLLISLESSDKIWTWCYFQPVPVLFATLGIPREISSIQIKAIISWRFRVL